MGTILHMQTEQVEQTAQDLIHGATTLLDKIDELSHSKSRMANNWDGGRSGEYQTNLTQIINELNTSVRAIDSLGYALEREVQQWVDADHHSSFLEEYVTGNQWELIQDGGRILVGAGLIAGLGTTLARPNSITLTVPGIFKGIFGGADNAKRFIGMTHPGTTVIRPENIPGQFNAGAITTKIAFADAAITSAKQVYSDYQTYGLSTRFVSASLVDTVIKGGTSFLMALAVGSAITAVAGMSAPLLVVGGATIAACVILPSISSHLQSAGWQWFENSGTRQQAIEAVNRTINQGGNAVQAVTQNLADRINQAFHPYINQLAPSP